MGLYIHVTAQDSRMVTFEHQFETTYAESNDHETDDVTRLKKIKVLASKYFGILSNISSDH